MKPVFVSISGKAGSGKDSIKQIIIDEFSGKRGFQVAPFSFAGPLKDALCLWMGWDRARLDHDFIYKEGGLGNTNPDDVDPYCVALGMTRREIMQRLGTECLRNGMHTNFWIILADLSVKLEKFQDFDIGIISDCRFTNELDWVKSIGGLTIKVERRDVFPGFNLTQTLDSTLTTHVSHASEKEFLDWENYDVQIYNIVDHNISIEENKENLVKQVLNKISKEMDKLLETK